MKLLLTFLFVVGLAFPVMAQHRGFHPGFHGGFRGGFHGDFHRGYPYPDAGGALLGGVLGFFLGRESASPPPAEEAPGVVLQPFTPDWYEYCANKFNTFDPKTGFFTGNDGQRHFCQ